jgi:hypothetical protein
MRIQYAVRVAAGAALAALLVGSTASSGVASVAPASAHVAPGHGSSEQFMMGPGCGASTS